MKKLFLISFLSSFALANGLSNFEIKLFPQGSDEYHLSIKGGDISYEKDMREIFRKKVYEVCGTRFEIFDIKFDQDNKKSLQGSFKCFVNSQM
tara:strand:+ start:2729 stop:3007 length:279 start_codon:yes stop_codon:yes gene_type:complete